MTTRFLGVLSAFVLGMIALPAQAGLQDDVETCREALSAGKHLDMDAYRLSFEKQKGNRTRTLTLEAIPHSGGDKFLVTCVISKGAVEDLAVEKL